MQTQDSAASLDNIEGQIRIMEKCDHLSIFWSSLTSVTLSINAPDIFFCFIYCLYIFLFFELLFLLFLYCISSIERAVQKIHQGVDLVTKNENLTLVSVCCIRFMHIEWQ